MTLFIRTPKRLFEISDIYVMALTLIIFFAVGRILAAVLKKLAERKKIKKIQVPNPKGGGLNLELSDDTELAYTILSCIADDERYLVKDPTLKEVIFRLVKANINGESIVLSPMFLRFLALKMINTDQTLITKIGNVVLSSNNRIRLLSRVSGTAVIGIVGGMLATFSYAILLMVIYFDSTQNCGYHCSEYFEQLPSDPAIVKVNVEKSAGQLVIAGNAEGQQVEIYTPSSDQKITSDSGDIITKRYKKVRKKVKHVKFSDFKKTDPVLSAFEDLEEPYVPQQPCDDPHDLIEIAIDGTQ